MTHDNKKALKAGFWYTFSNFLIKGIAFLTMPIFTRIMSKYDIGVFSNIISWFNILAIITTFEIYSSINIARFDYKDELDSYVSSSLILSTIITSIFYAIVLVFHSFFEELFLMDFKTLNIVFIYLLVYPALQMFQIRKQIDYDYKSLTIISIINSILSTGIAVLLVFVMNNKLMGRIYGHFIPSILICLILYVYLLLKGKSVTKKYWKYALVISFPLIWHLLAGYLLSSSDKIMITKLSSPEDNALYSVAYSISSLVSILWASLNSAWSPWAYDKMDKKDYTALKETSKPYTIFFLVIVLCMMLLTPEILYLMGGESYLKAKYVMPPVMIGYVFQFVYSLYVNIEFYHKKQRNIALGTIIAAALNILLNAIFIPKFGYIAAAYTTLIGYIALFLIHFYFVKRLNCTSWYDTKFFTKILSFSLILIIIFNLLYKFSIIRYGLLVIIFIIILFILIKNKKEIIESLKEKDINKLINVFRREKVLK